MKEKGQTKSPMPGVCLSGVLGRGSRVEAEQQAGAGHEQDSFRAWVLEVGGEECVAGYPLWGLSFYNVVSVGDDF